MAQDNNETIGVVLLNLGGPERLEDVAPFLYNLFSDRQIIRLSPLPFLQKPLAKLIASRRAPNSCKAYKQIGGGSPLRRITAEQGAAAEKLLARVGNFKVDMAMRYWHPDARETLTAFGEAGIKKIAAITLYPHYSAATTGSSMTDLRKVADSLPYDFEIGMMEAWPSQPDYIKSLVKMVRREIGRCATEPALLYSAHSLPIKFIEDGDPYLDHLAKTITALEAEIPLRGKLCFQSRSGPVRWLSPSTPDSLVEVAKTSAKEVVMVPISFVSDHVETLYEIDIQYGEMAEELGLKLRRSDSLNCDKDFIKCLAKLAVETCRMEQWI